MLVWTIVLAISTSVMAIAIGFTAGFAIVQWCSFKKSRHSALLMQIVDMWNSNDYITARNMIGKHSSRKTMSERSNNFKNTMVSLDQNNTPDYLIMVRVANFFENLGYLTCKKDYLPKDDALELFAGSAKYYWTLFSALANYDRNEREPKRPKVWEYFEKLATLTSVEV